MQTIKILDSTLRDGAQSEGISFSVQDKLRIVKILDSLGVSYIEAGNPFSNPKDIEFFREAAKMKFNNARLAAFGSTRRRNVKVEDDLNIKSLIDAGTKTVVIFGKAWDFHVTDIIQTSLEENLLMVFDTVRHLKSLGKEVIFDAEHFFDGFKANQEYAVDVLKAAAEGGAECLCLCDTNGGMFPDEVSTIVDSIKKKFDLPIGIHTHNDGGMAVANSIMAVNAGATHVQGTLTGIGERCGNANLSTIIANLQLKSNVQCIPSKNLKSITSACRAVAEISNISLGNMPFVGKSAFSHKAGMHIDGVLKSNRAFEHIDPEAVGNKRRLLMSEVAGKSAVIEKIQGFAPQISKDSPEVEEIVSRLKQLEYKGYQFEGAESSFELIVRKVIGTYKSFFDLGQFKIIGEQVSKDGGVLTSALIKIIVDGNEEITASEGDGPVHALDQALRKALEVFYPSLKAVHLTDYKVRVLDAKSATGAKVRVLIESTDGSEYWTTVGVSTDIIEASWIALVDSIEYKLIKDSEKVANDFNDN